MRDVLPLAGTSTYRIGSRNSPLAMKQAEYVRALLEKTHRRHKFEIVGMTSKGDRNLQRPIAQIGGKGLFTQELEQALLNETVDLAVHSMKDLPVETQTTELRVVSVGTRADPADLYVGRIPLCDLREDAVLGTSSARRKAQLTFRMHHSNVRDIRGNVGTRLAKLDEGAYDALILAAAGLERLGIDDRLTERFDPWHFVPSAGQGVLAAQFNTARSDVAALVGAISELSVEIAVTAERKVIELLDADCRGAIGVYCEHTDQAARMVAVVLAADGSHQLRIEDTGPQAIELALSVASRLERLGAKELLASP